MKSLFIKFVSAAFLAGVIAACSDGGGFAGIGGSGYISTGSVTGFGSVFVNGVEFHTDSSTTYEIEDQLLYDQSLEQTYLSVGMVVQVEGSINADGITGTAARIHYGDDLEGPVTDLISNPDGTVKTFKVLGVTVIAKQADTVFKNFTLGFDDLVNSIVVEISGHFDNNGYLQATYIERKTSSTSIVELKGTVSNFTNISSNFTVRSVNVNAADAVIEDLPNGIQNNAFVEVKGTYNGTVLTANRVEGDDNDLEDDGSEVSVEGYITDYASDSNFKINGYTINALDVIPEPDTLILANGVKVEAEGPVSNGVLNATKIESRDGNAEVSANVSIASVDIDNKVFDVEIFTTTATYNVAIKVTTATQMEDEIGTYETLTLSELSSTGGYVEVRGYETGTSEITATRIKRIATMDVEEYILQGYTTSATGTAESGGSITILGVEFPFDISVNTSGTTKFEDLTDANMNDTTINDLLDRINVPIPVLVKVKDVADTNNNEIGIADEIDLED